MPFGIPSEDFHGGFGLPHDEDNVIDVRTKEQKRLDAIEQDDYDPYTGKYAFVSPKDDISDAEYEAAAEEAHDNFIRSLIEAGGEMRELKAMLREAKDALLYMLILHKAQDPRCNQEKVVPALYMLKSGPDKWTPERADEVFRKIFDYLEQEEDDGT